LDARETQIEARENRSDHFEMRDFDLMPEDGLSPVSLFPNGKFLNMGATRQGHLGRRDDLHAKAAASLKEVEDRPLPLLAVHLSLSSGSLLLSFYIVSERC
jgi:hypothetical protein